MLTFAQPAASTGNNKIQLRAYYTLTGTHSRACNACRYVCMYAAISKCNDSKNCKSNVTAQWEFNCKRKLNDFSWNIAAGSKRNEIVLWNSTACLHSPSHAYSHLCTYINIHRRAALNSFTGVASKYETESWVPAALIVFAGIWLCVCVRRNATALTCAIEVWGVWRATGWWM